MPARRKKFLIAACALALLAALSQTPFIYRRHRLGKLRDAITELNKTRQRTSDADAYREFKGVIHVHSMLGGHSAGQLADIVSAARQNNLDFVLMTEHPSRETDTARATLNGAHDRVLFIGGTEFVTREGERILVAPSVSVTSDSSSERSAPPADAPTARDALAQFKTENRLSIVAYPEQWRDLNAGVYDGIEIYNLYTNSKKINYKRLFFDALWSYRSYADLLWTTFYEPPRENLKKWDELTSATNRRIAAFAGNDAHANVGLRLQDAANHQIFGVQLDPYERSFRVVRNHVLFGANENLNADSLIAALKNGHSFFAFDILCDATDFRFTAATKDAKKTMGDEIVMSGDAVRLRVAAPAACRVRLIKNGSVWREERGANEYVWETKEPGVYRVEAYLDQLPLPTDANLWIVSNPIYIR